MFTKEMKVAEAIIKHPRAREVLAGFNLGGCAFCAISEYETIEQVCEGYGIPTDELVKMLNELV